MIEGYPGSDTRSQYKAIIAFSTLNWVACMCHLVYLGPKILAHNLVIPVLAYFCGVAILSFKSRYGDDVWEMSVKEADLGMDYISLPLDRPEDQVPKQLCSRCQQQMQ